MLKTVSLLLVCFIVLSLTGCGGGSKSASSSKNPFTDTGTGTGNSQSQPIFGTISSAAGKTGITLKADRTSVDVNNGQVLLTAKIVREDAPVANVPVTFSIVAPQNGPATFEPGMTTVTTDSGGTAITRMITGNTPSTTNVIVQATVQIGTQTATTTTTFQIVRGNGVIMFTDKAGTPPGDQSNMLDPWEREIQDPLVTPSVAVLQLLPFKVTDSNGNPRVGVPITLSVYSITSQNPGDVMIDFLVPPVTEPNERTITTDSAGMGIFNVAVILDSPPPGSFTSSSVVFKATTNDAIPVTAYVGGSYSLTSKAPEPASAAGP